MSKIKKITTLLKKVLLIGLRVLVVLGVLGGLIGMGLYWQYIIKEPGDLIQKDVILEIISEESPIYYRGYQPNDPTSQEPIGVLFDGQHRNYVAYEALPKDWIHAIISAEDKHFFHHVGFDFLGIVRAVFQNFSAGRVVAGASTLTQQTAKNLYSRPDRSFRSKIEEAVNALRLE
ncbi:MAG: biosynthetic peptidoglycan transglycosylase, partial [Myxococcota bacterium]|nr:biosynthetic peptidoglycan transglycosylase [Myxococcota bacterium]